ncbi:hypothetical protein [Gordonia sp. NPDC003376]
MAQITTPVKGFSGTVAGVDFSKGVGETDSEGAIAYFERHGYTVTVEAAAVVVPEGDPSEKWTVDQLKAHAANKGIDLGEAAKKADILAVLARPAT